MDVGGVGVGWGVTAELLADTLLYHKVSGWLEKHAQGPEGCKFHQMWDSSRGLNLNSPLGEKKFCICCSSTLIVSVQLLFLELHAEANPLRHSCSIFARLGTNYIWAVAQSPGCSEEGLLFLATRTSSNRSRFDVILLIILSLKCSFQLLGHGGGWPLLAWQLWPSMEIISSFKKKPPFNKHQGKLPRWGLIVQNNERRCGVPLVFRGSLCLLPPLRHIKQNKVNIVIHHRC